MKIPKTAIAAIPPTVATNHKGTLPVFDMLTNSPIIKLYKIMHITYKKY